jgi:hypothetical protein
MVGGKLVGSHRPAGGGLSLRLTSRPLEHGPGMPEWCRLSKVDNVCACGLLAW